MTSPLPLAVKIKKYSADTITPVALYLKVRAQFPNSLLLEGSDYRGNENSFSYICFDPLAEVRLEGTTFKIEAPLSDAISLPAGKEHTVHSVLSRFLSQFTLHDPSPPPRGVVHGVYGYLAYDAVRYIEHISLSAAACPGEDIPLMRYALFRNVIAINHFTDELFHIRYGLPQDSTEELDIPALLNAPVPETKGFHLVGAEQSNMTDAEHQEMILRCKAHIARGDVFQIVPSRKFSHEFAGDEFAVYRALRSLNPSPYLFYFDYGSYRIFGSSPESQIVVKDGRASIFPIAGTYRRTGNDAEDSAAAAKLLDDPKESAEHVMLVDLARNDLSIHCHPVVVDQFKEVQLYSHVIHLVSKVSGALPATTRGAESAVEVLTATFPAGTLSGAPKYRAMQLIDTYERGRRHFYGGGLGIIGFDGSVNHAIMIRSFLSKSGTLWSQAGSGIVADSDPATEVQEVRNKLAALHTSLRIAEGQESRAELERERPRKV